LVGSLTGAVDSKRVTELPKGWLASDGNRRDSAKAKASLTARLTSRADRKLGLSDPLLMYDSGRAQRIKATPGITG